MKKPLTPEHEARLQKKLAVLRGQIDRADRALFRALGLRARASARIARVKRELDMPVFQPQRWREVLRARSELAVKLGLSRSFARALLALIHKESIRIQNQPLKKSGRKKQ